MAMIEAITQDHSRVRVWCDAVLYEGVPRGVSRYASNHQEKIYAMSLVGQEQAVQAVIAGCAIDQMGQRTKLAFNGPRATISGVWAPRLRVHGCVLAPHIVHAVVVPKLDLKNAGDDAVREQVVVPTPGEDIKAAIYRTIQQTHSTPLIPTEVHGQPAWEAAAGAAWRDRIAAEIIREHETWTPLHLHPDLTDQTWANAGLLSTSNAVIDELVTRLVREGELVIPEAA